MTTLAIIGTFVVLIGWLLALHMRYSDNDERLEILEKQLNQQREFVVTQFTALQQIGEATDKVLQADDERLVKVEKRLELLRVAGVV